MKIFKSDRLNEKFKTLKIQYDIRHGLNESYSVYFDISNSKRVVKFCKENNVGILGIEGFLLDDKYIIDLMNIYDATIGGIGNDFYNFVKISTSRAPYFLEDEKTMQHPSQVMEFNFIEKDNFENLATKELK